MDVEGIFGERKAAGSENRVIDGTIPGGGREDVNLLGKAIWSYVAVPKSAKAG